MRYECEAFDGCFVEFSDSWTRGELRRASGESSTIGDTWAVAIGKVTACHIERIGEDALTGPEQLSTNFDDALYDSVDVRLFEWLAHAVMRVAVDMPKLGNAIAASLWTSTETAQAAKAEK